MAALPGSGDAFAGHLIEDEIGRGGMGVVFRATNPELAVERAIKVIAPEHSANPVYAARFQRESRLAAAVEHPNVVPIHAAGEDRGLLFIVMRLVEGPDLDLLLRAGPLEPDRAIGILRQVAGALDAAHEAGLVHRDVKPGNVLVEERGGEDHVFLTDFGVSKRSSELTDAERETGLTIEGQVLGTAGYLAPEQIEEGVADRRADVYSLACVAFHALAGRPPFSRATELGTLVAHAREERPDATVANPGLTRAVDHVLHRGMAIDPAARPASATELIEELELAVRSPSRRTRPGARASRTPRRPPVPALLAGVGVAAALAVAYLLLRPADDAPPAAAPEPRPTPEVVTVPLEDGSSPVGVVVDGSTAFIASRDAAQPGGPPGAIDRLAVAGAELHRSPIAVPSPRSIAVGDSMLWVANGEALYRVPRNGDAPQRIEAGETPDDVAVAGRSVWVSDEGGGSVSRFDVDAANAAAEVVAVGDEPRSIAATPDAAWVAAAGDGVVVRVDADTMRVEARIPVGAQPTSVVAGGGSVWVADNAENTVREIDPRRNEVVGAPIEVAPGPRGLAYGRGSLWVASGPANVVERFDPDTGDRIGRPIPVGTDPADVVSSGSAVITANQHGNSVSVIRP